MAQKITSLWNSIAPDFSKLEHFSAAHEKTQEGAYWASLQLFHHILAKNNREDPLTDQSMPLPLIDTLLQIGCILRQEGRELPEDNLQRILQLCCSAVSEILEHPRQKLLRSHPFLPVSKVREMDTRCMAWLAKQPGKRVREKIGVKQHILGVRRKISADTIENRVLRRLIDELKPMIERRLDIVHHYSISDRDYIKLLQKMLHICSDALYSSALKDVPSSHTLQANNVLLSDRAYNKVWRAFKRLQEYQNRVEQIWKDGPNQFTIMAFWLFIARLYERTHVLLYDDFCLLQPGLISSLFGIQAHLKGSWQAAENPKLSLTVSLGNSLFDLDMEVKGNAIHIDSTRLYEADGYIARSSQSPTHNCRVELNFLSSEISDSKEASSIKEFWIQRGFAQGRYMPFTGQFYWNEGELSMILQIFWD
ncbi:MAG: DUF2357 domain-containing protein [Candidatus Brocadiae bacterium]|nr:DUF2357 domain-containing protein [Candidatus Brocadiia bacterium]